jgi:3-oxoacyl-[acyl-carrier protein] reductase
MKMTMPNLMRTVQGSEGYSTHYDKHIALITGSSRGLGLAIAKELGYRRFRTILTGRSQANLDQALRDLSGDNHIAFTLDFLNIQEIEQFLIKILNAGLIPYILIHNLGGKLKGDSFPLDKKILDASMKLNLDVAIKINERFLPFMIQKKFGRIIHIGSDASLTGRASPAYVIAKAALNGYVKTSARYYAKHNVMFCAVLPGIFEHDGSAWSEKKMMQPDYYQKRMGEMPLGRFGKPDEIATFVAELAASDSMMYAGGLFELRGAI